MRNFHARNAVVSVERYSIFAMVPDAKSDGTASVKSLAIMSGKGRHAESYPKNLPYRLPASDDRQTLIP